MRALSSLSSTTSTRTDTQVLQKGQPQHEHHLVRKRTEAVRLGRLLPRAPQPHHHRAAGTSFITQSAADWNYFSTIFNRKDPKLFEYQCHCLYLDNKGKNWQLEEENLLKEIIGENCSSEGPSSTPQIKWHEVSKLLFQTSEKKYFRSPKQCRERWNNHLDPSKVKGMWKREECLLMFEYVQEHGKKWASIVRLLKNRNEHSIKNKFNSLLKKQEKFSKNMTEEEMHLQIITRIKSAIANERWQLKNQNIDFDLDDEDDEEMLYPRKFAEENKASNFAEKLMHKFMAFGSKEENPVKK
jgi:hypothetical protein